MQTTASLRFCARIEPWSQVDVSDPRTKFSQSKFVGGRVVAVPVDEDDAPWSVRLFGEKRLNFIILDKAKLSASDASYIDSLQSLFPEADGVHVSEPGGTTRWPPEDVASFFP